MGRVANFHGNLFGLQSAIVYSQAVDPGPSSRGSHTAEAPAFRRIDLSLFCDTSVMTLRLRSQPPAGQLASYAFARWRDKSTLHLSQINPLNNYPRREPRVSGQGREFCDAGGRELLRERPCVDGGHAYFVDAVHGPSFGPQRSGYHLHRHAGHEPRRRLRPKRRSNREHTERGCPPGNSINTMS